MLSIRVGDLWHWDDRTHLGAAQSVLLELTAQQVRAPLQDGHRHLRHFGLHVVRRAHASVQQRHHAADCSVAELVRLHSVDVRQLLAACTATLTPLLLSLYVLVLKVIFEVNTLCESMKHILQLTRMINYEV